MNETQVLQKLHKLKDDVKSSLRTKGIVAPIKTKRGIKLDDYEIVLEKSGYTIYNRYQEKSYSNIYFLQTAVLIANASALRKTVRDEWIIDDRTAGAADFDVQLYDYRFSASLKKNDMFGIQHYQTRLSESKLKYNTHITSINSAYFGLINQLKSVEKSNK